MNQIVTFYSYKGGVGRSMALANIAVLLAQMKRAVLMIDWDLEAPGLEEYFRDHHIEHSSAGGLIDLLSAAKEAPEQPPNWKNFVSRISVGTTDLFLIGSGRSKPNYESRVQSFDWAEFFEAKNGGAFLESLREDWKSFYDYTFIDSRTGITDSNSVCTILLPDVIVPLFTCTEQSLLGVKNVVELAQVARQKLVYERPALTIFPLASRFDGRSEYRLSQSWLDRFANELHVFYESWLPQGVRSTDTSVLPDDHFSSKPQIQAQIVRVRSIIEETKLPYVAYFSFGEKLPVLEKGKDDPDGLGRAYGLAAAIIETNFRDIESVLKPNRTAAISLAAVASTDATLSGAMLEVASKPLASVVGALDRLTWARAHAALANYGPALKAFKSVVDDFANDARFWYDYASAMYDDPFTTKPMQILELAIKARRVERAPGNSDLALRWDISTLIICLHLYHVGGSYDDAIIAANEMLAELGSIAPKLIRFLRACAFGQLYQAETKGGLRELQIGESKAIREIIMRDVSTVIAFGFEFQDQLRLVSDPQFRDPDSIDDDLQTFASAEPELCALIGIDRPKPSKRQISRRKLPAGSEGRGSIQSLVEDSPF